MRHIGHPGEMTLPHLLAAAGIVQHHALHQQGIGEIGDMGVVERDVAVFADTHESEIHRFGRQFDRITRGHFIGMRSVALQIVSAPRLHFFGKSGPNPEPEAGRVRGRQTDIFVQMKCLHFRPIDLSMASQRRNQIQLRIAGAHHDPRFAVPLDRGGDDPRRVGRGGFAEFDFISKNPHGKSIDRKKTRVCRHAEHLERGCAKL